MALSAVGSASLVIADAVRVVLVGSVTPTDLSWSAPLSLSPAPVNAGQSFNAGAYWHAFLWDKNNGMTDLGRPSGYLGSIGRDANDAGQVGGGAWVCNDADPRAFISGAR